METLPSIADTRTATVSLAISPPAKPTIAELQNRVAVKLLNRIIAEERQDYLVSVVHTYKVFCEANANLGAVDVSPDSTGD